MAAVVKSMSSVETAVTAVSALQVVNVRSAETFLNYCVNKRTLKKNHCVTDSEKI